MKKGTQTQIPVVHFNKFFWKEKKIERIFCFYREKNCSFVFLKLHERPHGGKKGDKRTLKEKFNKQKIYSSEKLSDHFFCF